MTDHLVELLENPSFRSRILTSDQHPDHFRNISPKECPEKSRLIQKARHIMLALHNEVVGNYPSPSVADRIFENISAQKTSTGR